MHSGVPFSSSLTALVLRPHFFRHVTGGELKKYLDSEADPEATEGAARFLLSVALESVDAQYGIRATALRATYLALPFGYGEEVISTFMSNLRAFDEAEVFPETFGTLILAANTICADGTKALTSRP